MIQIETGRYRTCDGLSRRSVLKLGALTFGGLGLAPYLAAQAKAVQTGRSLADMSVILVWQGGGPSHLDMWDLKPEAPSEYRGTFNPIASSIAGYQVSEHMPELAKICHKLAIIRSVTHLDSGHESASHFLLTGYKPTNDIPAQEAPSYGSIVGHEMGTKTPGFPAYVSLPKVIRSGAAGYLGLSNNAFETHSNANEDNFQVRNLKPSGVPIERFQKRIDLLKKFDTMRRDVDRSGLVAGMDGFTQQAWDLVTSPKVQEAFDMTKESDATRERYGRKDPWGQNMLLARRLVEAGVRFVTVDIGGWDTHNNNFEEHKKKLPPFDKGLSALVNDLDERGRLDSTLILVWGEFGRTPKINPSSGRDHWPNVFTAVMAGGGVRRGVVLGESDARAEQPKSHPVSPQDVLATMYHQLGIDRHKAFINEANRPVEILNYGEPIAEIL